MLAFDGCCQWGKPWEGKKAFTLSQNLKTAVWSWCHQETMRPLPFTQPVKCWVTWLTFLSLKFLWWPLSAFKTFQKSAFCSICTIGFAYFLTYFRYHKMMRACTHKVYEWLFLNAAMCESQNQSNYICKRSEFIHVTLQRRTSTKSIKKGKLHQC